jgi:predicted ATPase
MVTVGGGFQAAVSRRGGVSSIRCLAARKHPGIEIKVSVGTNEYPEYWVYVLIFTQDNNRNPIIKNEIVFRNGMKILSRPDQYDYRDEYRLRQSHAEQISANQEFRELVSFFTSIKYLHLIPQLIREPERSVGRVNDPFGGDFLEIIASTPQKTRESRLRKILEALKIAVPQLNDLNLDRDLKGFWHVKAKYAHWRPQGAWQTEESFSDGTLRLLGLLWSMLEAGGPLLIEEPEIYFHPAVVRQIPLMFARMQRKGGRQVLVTTHSEALLSDDGIGLDEVHLITPGPEGSTAATAKDMEDVRDLLTGGVPLGEAILPKAQPKKVNQLALFD